MFWSFGPSIHYGSWIMILLCVINMSYFIWHAYGMPDRLCVVMFNTWCCELLSLQWWWDRSCCHLVEPILTDKLEVTSRRPTMWREFPNLCWFRPKHSILEHHLYRCWVPGPCSWETYMCWGLRSSCGLTACGFGSTGLGRSHVRRQRTGLQATMTLRGICCSLCILMYGSLE